LDLDPRHQQGYGRSRKNRGGIYLGELSPDHLRRTTVRRRKTERIGQRARRGGHRTLYGLEGRRDRNRKPIGNGWRRGKGRGDKKKNHEKRADQPACK